MTTTMIQMMMIRKEIQKGSCTGKNTSKARNYYIKYKRNLK